MNTKLDTLTVGQLKRELSDYPRHLSLTNRTNVIEIRLTTRGLEVETTPDEELTGRIETLERELEESEDSYKCSERENNELADERDKLLEDVRTLELKVEELEKEIAGLKPV